jgi:predicted DCC family thiol-disulfide oxidoreductase YuxK
LANDLQREARELRPEITRAAIIRPSESIDPTSSPIILYDGVCGFCNRLVQFTLRHDSRAIFRFAALQSDLAARVLARHAANSSGLGTLYVIINPNQPAEYLLSRSAAVLFVLNQLGRWCRATSILLHLIPRFLRDATYNIIARHRYRIFGRSETCTLPSVQDRTRFLDLDL